MTVNTENNTHPPIYYIELGAASDNLVRINNKKAILNTLSNEERDIKLPKWSDSNNLKLAESIKTLPNLPIAIHTGKSNLLIIDFDDETFYEALQLNDSLDDEHKCQFIASSVGKIGGHFVYQYSNNILTDFIGNPNGKKQNCIDTLYGNTIVYHANKANKTKTILVDTNKPLTTIPLAMQYFLITKYNKDNIKVIEKQANVVLQGTKLATIAGKAIKDEQAMEVLLSIITPNRYKSILAQSHKSLFPNHPDRLPMEESAHMYLVALSCVLMLDYSIDTKLHAELICALNDMFSEPLDSKRVKSIIDKDINSDKYNYDPNWQQKSLIILNTNSEPLEIFMYNQGGAINYIVFNQYTYELITFSSATAVIDFITSTTRNKISRDKLTKLSVYVNIISDPSKPFGFNYKTNVFNIYKWNEEQNVFYQPNDYYATWTKEEKDLMYNKEHPRYPKVTLAALENSVGELLYTHFLPFMRRKYARREHSSLFFILYGVPHSFKSALVNGVFSKLSENRYKLLSLEVLTDKYNDWMLDTDLVLMDEVHHLVTNDRLKLIKQINEITGNSMIAGVRRMHQSVDTKSYKNEITFFLTTNDTIQITTEIQDRRMVVFKSTKRVADALGITNEEIRNAIIRESKDFAYYLAQHVTDIPYNQYITNQTWKTSSYDDFQENALRYEDKIAKAIDTDNCEQFINICIELNIKEADIINAISQYNYKYYIRLLNTNPLRANSPALLSNNIDKIDEKLLYKKLQNVSNVSYKVQDNKDNKYTGNKRTSALFTRLPDRIKEIFDNKRKEEINKNIEELKKASQGDIL
ncbi:primase-helicase family protein [Campylobacter jejuni]|nr:hypothetical protein [Campylobacter jejuni]EAK2833565.1 hypothetical protein [Campylobacter jejuni]